MGVSSFSGHPVESPLYRLVPGDPPQSVSAVVMNNNAKAEQEELEEDYMGNTEGRGDREGEEGEGCRDFAEVQGGEHLEEYQDQKDETDAGEDRSILEKCVVRREDGEKGWQCVMCGKMRENKSHLIEHVECAHYPYVFKNICPHCDMQKKTTSALRKHIYVHHKDKPKV